MCILQKVVYQTVMKSCFWFKTNGAFLLNQRLVSLKPRGHFSVRNGVLVKN
jgi:hypothetical protein